jgi:hypothetical protein
MRAASVEFVEPEPRMFGAGSYNERTYARNPVEWTQPRPFHGPFGRGSGLRLGAERRMTPAQEHVSTAWFIDPPLVDTGSH